MNVYFNLNLISNCTLQISDLTQEHDEYLPQESNLYVTPGRFKYTDTYTVNVIKCIEVQKTDIVSTIITSHTDGETPLFCDEAYCRLQKDGYYIIDHIIIPSIECVQNNVNNSLYDIIYATDGIDFFKLVDGSFIKCSIVDLINTDSELNTTISKASQSTFSLCLLNNKYLELCKQQFDQLMTNRCKINQQLDLDIDLIWMSLNAIKYYVEFGMLTQAQALLEEIFRCTGIAKLNKNNKTDNHGCKCCL